MKPITPCLLLILSGAALAQDDPPPVEATHLAGPVWMLSGRGGNVAVSAGEDGVVMVDDQFAPMTEPLLAAIREFSDAPLRFVINTHWHGDHTGGNENLAGEGALIVAHDNVRQRMSTEQFTAFSNSTTPPAPAAALPVVTFNDTATLHLNGEAVTVRHVPFAHTDGDAIVHFTGSGVLHMGDTFWNGYYPRIDTDTGASVQGAMAAVELGLELCAEGTRVIPGHGPVSDCQGLRAYLEMLRTTTARVQALIDEGRTLEEIVELQPNADYDAGWGQWYIRPGDYLGFLYQSLTRPDSP